MIQSCPAIVSLFSVSLMELIRTPYALSIIVTISSWNFNFKPIIIPRHSKNSTVYEIYLWRLKRRLIRIFLDKHIGMLKVPPCCTHNGYQLSCCCIYLVLSANISLPNKKNVVKLKVIKFIQYELMVEYIKCLTTIFLDHISLYA